MSFLSPSSEKIRSFQTKSYDKQVLLCPWTDLPYKWENNFPHDLKVKETAALIPRDSDKSCRIQWHSSSFVYFILPWAQFQSSFCASGRSLDKRTPGVLSSPNYLTILCSGSGLQRHCYILTASYLQDQGIFQSCVLSPCWYKSWGLSIFLFPFSFSPPISPSPIACENILGQLERVHALSKSLVWMVRRPGSGQYEQETCETSTPTACLLWHFNAWLSSHPLMEGELNSLKAWNICNISKVIFRACWRAENAVVAVGLSLWRLLRKKPFPDPFLRPIWDHLWTCEYCITPTKTCHKEKQQSKNCTLRKSSKSEFTSCRRIDDKTTFYWKHRIYSHLGNSNTEKYIDAHKIISQHNNRVGNKNLFHWVA